MTRGQRVNGGKLPLNPLSHRNRKRLLTLRELSSGVPPQAVASAGDSDHSTSPLEVNYGASPAISPCARRSSPVGGSARVRS